MTPQQVIELAKHLLWIAFRLYLCGIGDTAEAMVALIQVVVNCFQIVSLWYWWHPNRVIMLNTSSCELLSDCIFVVLVTPCYASDPWDNLLWIAFRLYLCGIGDTRWKVDGIDQNVVNCFQIVSLWYWWHHKSTLLMPIRCCELLSDCIFVVLVTPKAESGKSFCKLWIAFRLYLCGIGDTDAGQMTKQGNVVNCFQIVSLWYWWHQN